MWPLFCFGPDIWLQDQFLLVLIYSSQSAKSSWNNHLLFRQIETRTKVISNGALEAANVIMQLIEWISRQQVKVSE